ncbi:MAG TPA: dockerin type I repeat-containing protein, partial [Thermoanaerobaculia bacterium]|nr:dockerin type I repeat-containing protein [Thermoanaerobaculia bacterium]
SSGVALSNSILFNTNASTYNDFFCAFSTIASNDFNIIVAAGACAVSGGYGTTAPSLLPLAANGWLTVTHALEAGAGVDSGDLAGCKDENGGPLIVDQRGVKRPIGARCDLGAFEKEPIGDANGDGIVNVADVFYLINYLFAAGPVPLGRGNVNGGDGTITVADVFYLINYLFAGGTAPV